MDAQFLCHFTSPDKSNMHYVLVYTDLRQENSGGKARAGAGGWTGCEEDGDEGCRRCYRVCVCVCVCVLHGVDSYSLHFSRSYITSIHRMPAPSMLCLLPVSAPFLHPALSSSSSPLISPLSLLPLPAPTAPNISRPTRRAEVQIAIALRLRGKYGAILAHLITGGALLSHISAVDLLR